MSLRDCCCTRPHLKLLFSGISIFLFASLAAQAQLYSFELGIVESGSGASARFDVELQSRTTFLKSTNYTLMSPAGDSFSSDSVLENRVRSDLLISFDSLERALSYLEGSWHLAYDTFRFNPYGETTVDTTLTIDPIPVDSLRRELPELLSPLNRFIPNGQQHLLSWQYATDEPQLTTFHRRPLFEPDSTGISWSTVGRPSPTGSSFSRGRSGVGDTFFERSLESVPGASDYRYYQTLTTAENALPLDVEFTMSVPTYLNDSLTINSTSHTGVFPAPSFGVNYRRVGEPFLLTLVVPEPSTSWLIIVALGAILGWRNAAA